MPAKDWRRKAGILHADRITSLSFTFVNEGFTFWSYLLHRGSLVYGTYRSVYLRGRLTLTVFIFGVLCWCSKAVVKNVDVVLYGKICDSLSGALP